MSTDPTDRPDPTAVKDLQTQLERALIDEFLRTHGYDPANVSGPPNAELELLMKQAGTYARPASSRKSRPGHTSLGHTSSTTSTAA